MPKCTCCRIAQRARSSSRYDILLRKRQSGLVTIQVRVKVWLQSGKDRGRKTRSAVCTLYRLSRLTVLRQCIFSRSDNYSFNVTHKGDVHSRKVTTCRLDLGCSIIVADNVSQSGLHTVSEELGRRTTSERLRRSCTPPLR